MTVTKRAFVLMPFSEPLNAYYAVIFKPALAAAGYEVTRADDIYTPRPVMLDVQEGIAKADVVLCEMTGRNPNVFYELGLAHAIGKQAILLSGDAADVPFDLRHIRVILYDCRRAGWEERLRGEITKAARSASSVETCWPPPLGSRANEHRERLGAGDATVHEDDRVVSRPLNLSFDSSHWNGMPHGWFDSSGHVTGVSTDYRVSVVHREDGAPGACLMLYKEGADRKEFGSVMQRFPAGFLAGKAVRLSGELRSRGISGWAGLWLRADATDIPNLFFDNMSRRSIHGDTTWTSYSIDAQLPKETEWLNIGIVMAGPGLLYADNIRLMFWSNKEEWQDA